MSADFDNGEFLRFLGEFLCFLGEFLSDKTINVKMEDPICSITCLHLIINQNRLVLASRHVNLWAFVFPDLMHYRMSFYERKVSGPYYEVPEQKE